MARQERSNAFMARFQGKISTIDASGPGKASRQNKRPSQPRKQARKQDSRDDRDFEFENDYAQNYAEDQNDSYQVPSSTSNQQRKPKLRDLDDMMMRQSMQYAGSMNPPPPPPQQHDVKNSRRQQPSYSYQSSDEGYLPTPGREPVRDRSKLSPQNKGNAREQRRQWQQMEDDPINQYYKNRPKQAPSKARETYLDRQLRDHTREDNSKKLNEKHIRNDKDQLHFSRKARPVNYKPRNLKQWKETKQDYVELGKLKPDLNTDELVEKRANRDRVKEFAQNLHNINQRICKRDNHKPPKPVPKPKSTRDKAQEYAKRVRKPRVHRRPEPVVRQTDDELLNDGGLGAEAELTPLEELEMKHNAARKEVDAIRNEMTKRGLK